MRHMTRSTTLSFQWRMFENEGALLIRVTLQAAGVRARSQSRLLQFKAAVGIVAIGALNQAFKHTVPEGHVELGLLLRVTTQAELRLAALKHLRAANIDVASGDFGN